MVRHPNYVYVYAWARMLGSTPRLAHRLAIRAAEEHAPEQAVFWSHLYGRWMTLDEVSYVVWKAKMAAIQCLVSEYEEYLEGDQD